MTHDFGPTGERAWRKLRRAMRLARGFCLHTVEIDAAAIGEQICRRLTDDGLAVCRLRLTGWTAAAQVDGLLDELLTGPGIDDQVIVIIAEGPDAGPDLREWAYVFSVLNRVRNSLVKACRTDLLFCGPRWFQELGWGAADLWSVRSTSVRIPLPTALQGLPIDGRPWTGFWDRDWQIVGEAPTIADARVGLIEQADALMAWGDLRCALLTRMRAARLRPDDMGGWAFDAEMAWIESQAGDSDLRARCWAEKAWLRAQVDDRPGLGAPPQDLTIADAGVIALLEAVGAEANAATFAAVVRRFEHWPEMQWWTILLDAEAAFATGELERAERQALRAYESAAHPGQSLAAQRCVFRVLERGGDWHGARERSDAALANATNLSGYAWALAAGHAADMRSQQGEVDEALDLYRREMEVFEALGDRRSRAIALGYIARILKKQGKVDEALTMHRQQVETYQALGHRRDRAIALGDIAHILNNKGEVDEALALHLEEMEVYEAIGDRSSRAGTLGDIAHILASTGEVDKALGLYREEMGVYKALGDRRSRAVTLGDIARIFAKKGNVDGALALHREQIQVYEALGDPRSRAITLGDIARILNNKGKVDEALALHREQIEVYEALSDHRERAITLGDIARILNNKGKVDEALALHREQLEVYEALGDRRERAISLGDIARILKTKGKVDEALALNREQMEVYEALGDRRERAITLGDIAHILADRGKVDEALALHREEMEVYEALGDRRARAATLRDIARILPPAAD